MQINKVGFLNSFQNKNGLNSSRIQAYGRLKQMPCDTVSFTSSEAKFEIDVEKTTQTILSTKIYSILFNEQKRREELVNDAILFATGDEDSMTDEEKQEDLRNATLKAMMDDKNSLVENVLKGIKNEDAKVQFAFYMKQMYDKNKDIFAIQTKAKAQLYAKRMMKISKTSNGYDLSNFDEKFELIRKIDDIQDNTKSIFSRVDYFEDVFANSKNKNGKFDFKRFKNIIALLENCEFRDPSIPVVSGVMDYFVEKSPLQADLITEKLIDLSSYYSMGRDEYFVRAFANCFNPKDNQFTTERFELLEDIIDSIDNENRNGQKSFNLMDKSFDIYDDCIARIIDSYFNEIVNKDQKFLMNSMYIDKFVSDSLDELLN